jgi:hypothetical protein
MLDRSHHVFLGTHYTTQNKKPLGLQVNLPSRYASRQVVISAAATSKYLVTHPPKLAGIRVLGILQAAVRNILKSTAFQPCSIYQFKHAKCNIITIDTLYVCITSAYSYI